MQEFSWGRTFDLAAWIGALDSGRSPLDPLGDRLGSDSRKARRWLSAIERAGLAHRNHGYLELTGPGAFWIHLVQNHFALTDVNTLWTAARHEAWPAAIAV